MGAALSGFRRPRPEPDDPSSSDEEPPDAKRVKAAPYVLTVLQSSESVTKVLAYTGAGCVLTLETLSATAHETVRGLNVEFEAPTTSDALRWGLILADRAELFALRRAGTLQKDRLAFSTTYCSEPVTGRSSDVEHLREGVVRFASPRLPVAITTEDPLVDIALSEENLDAHARLHRGLLCQGVVRLDLTAQKGDLLGLRNQARYEGDSRCGGNWSCGSASQCVRSRRWRSGRCDSVRDPRRRRDVIYAQVAARWRHRRRGRRGADAGDGADRRARLAAAVPARGGDARLRAAREPADAGHRSIIRPGCCGVGAPGRGDVGPHQHSFLLALYTGAARPRGISASGTRILQ